MNRNILIIGNADYNNQNKLHFVNIDIENMKSCFLSKDYSVEDNKNLNRVQMLEKITAFVKKAQRESINLLYFSGHGCVNNGKNYICGIETSNNDGLISYDEILNVIESNSFGSKFLIILDTCRSNSLYSDLRIPDNVCLVCSSQVSEPSVGSQKGSAYTKCFVKAYKEISDCSLRDLLYKVQKEFDLTEYDQTPIILDRLLEDDIYLKKPIYSPKVYNGIENIDEIIYKFVFNDGDKNVLKNMIKLSNKYNMPLLTVNYYFSYYQFSKSNLEPNSKETESIVFLSLYDKFFTIKNGEYYYDNQKITMGDIPDCRIGDPKKNRIIDTTITNVSARIHDEKVIISISTKIIDGYKLQISSNLFCSYLSCIVKGGNARVELPIDKCSSVKIGDSLNITISSPVVEVQKVDIKNRIGMSGRNLSGQNTIIDSISGKTIYYATTVELQ